MAVRVGQRGVTSYLVLENSPEDIWVGLDIKDTLAAIGWLQ